MARPVRVATSRVFSGGVSRTRKSGASTGAGPAAQVTGSFQVPAPGCECCCQCALGEDNGPVHSHEAGGARYVHLNDDDVRAAMEKAEVAKGGHKTEHSIENEAQRAACCKARTELTQKGMFGAGGGI